MRIRDNVWKRPGKMLELAGAHDLVLDLVGACDDGDGYSALCVCFQRVPIPATESVCSSRQRPANHREEGNMPPHLTLKQLKNFV